MGIQCMYGAGFVLVILDIVVKLLYKALLFKFFSLQLCDPLLVLHFPSVELRLQLPVCQDLFVLN